MREDTTELSDLDVEDVVNVAPLDLLPFQLRMPNSLPLFPVLELSLVRPRWLPNELASILIGRPREPPRLVRRQLASLALPPSVALVLLKLGLELVGAFKVAGLEGVLVGPQAAIGRRDPRLEVVV